MLKTFGVVMLQVRPPICLNPDLAYAVESTEEDVCVLTHGPKVLAMPLMNA